MSGRYGRRYAKKDEDFDEGDVWGMMEDNNKEMMMINSSPKVRKPIKDSTFFTPPSSTTTTSSPRNFTAPRMIPKSSSSEVFTVGNSNKQQSSAPMDIPDWSKIYGKTSTKKNGITSTTNSSPWVNNNNNGHHNNNDGFYYGMSDHHYGSNGYGDHHHGDDDSDSDDDGMVPPHEYLARKLARNEISSFSVYEGIGRTLKGRDLSKVRNTILSKTGFLESS